jgi:hypothetical protein
MPQAWVAITDELMDFLPDPEESFSRAGVRLIERGNRKVSGVRWWLIETSASIPAYNIPDRGMLPVTYGLDRETRKPYVIGPAGTIPLDIA